MAEIIIDSSNPRLWLMRTSREPGVEEFVASVERAMAENPNQEKFALIIDMRESQSKTASSEARKQASAFIKKHEDWFAEAMVGVARVSPDPVIRGVLDLASELAESQAASGQWPLPLNSLAMGASLAISMAWCMAIPGG